MYQPTITDIPNYNECAHRLPCGVCRMTNNLCPICCGQTKIDWSGSPVYNQSPYYTTATTSGKGTSKSD